MEQYNKPPITYTQQVELLESRGLIVVDKIEAERFLSQVNYYRFSAYCLSFEKSRHIFKPGVSFGDIRSLYEFDRCLRFLIDEALEVVEIYLRSLVLHQLSHAYGAFAHEESKTFKPTFDHATWIVKIHDEAQRSREKFIIHYKNKYIGFPSLPIWMAVEVMSFGAVSQLYRNMQPKDQIALASIFGLHSSVFPSWLHTFTYIRNICAHHSRLWSKELAIAMVLPKKPEWNGVNTRRIASVIFALEYMLSKLPEGKDIAFAWHQEICAPLQKPVKTESFYESMGLTEYFIQHPLLILGKREVGA